MRCRTNDAAGVLGIGSVWRGLSVCVTAEDEQDGVTVETRNAHKYYEPNRLGFGGMYEFERMY
jgi:hypothetical protein